MDSVDSCTSPLDTCLQYGIGVAPKPIFQPLLGRYGFKETTRRDCSISYIFWGIPVKQARVILLII